MSKPVLTEDELEKLMRDAGVHFNINFTIHDCIDRAKEAGWIEKGALEEAREKYEVWMKAGDGLQGELNAAARLLMAESDLMVHDMRDLYEQAIKELQEKG